MKYNKKEFNKLIKYTQKILKMRIVVLYHPFIDEAEGFFYYFTKQPLYIEIILPQNTTPDWNYYASIIIHECSHWILSFRPHSEKETWDLGKILFPKSKIPINYNKYAIKCLKTYGKLAKMTRNNTL